MSVQTIAPEQAATEDHPVVVDNVNYSYFVWYVGEAAAAKPGLRVLDFGCGRGEMVAMLRAAGFDCSGCDVFYDGADWDDPRLIAQLDAGHVREIAADGTLPFEDGSFDLIVSNQVFEHVEHIEPVVAELTRVLARDGRMYHHFPSLEVVREGHIGIPLAHRFPAGRVRRLYTLALRRLGVGSHKDENPDPAAWTDFKLDWLDRYCFYRPYRAITDVFGRDYEIRHREIDYCRFRARGRGGLVERLIDWPPAAGIVQRLFRRLAFMAIELDRR